MEMYTHLSRFFFAAALTSIATLSTPVLAAGNGSSPKGKPFIAINDQIVEVTGITTDLQDQINALVAQVDTIEDRIGANETAIYDLQENSYYLESMIAANATSVTAIEGEIAALAANIEDLQTQINSATGDISDLEAQLAADEALIASLQGALIALQRGSIDADADLQAQIDSNNELIGALLNEIEAINASLDMNQDITTGVCPRGQAVVEIGNGYVACDATPTGVTSVTQYRYYSYRSVSAYYRTSLTHYCPSGFISTGGGGYFYPAGLLGTFDAGHSAGTGTYRQGWISYNNQTSYRNYLYTMVNCLRFN